MLALSTPSDSLVSLISQHKTLILSGAGISTDSGIPDYRSPESLKKNHKPMRYQEFVASKEARQRYWSRSLVGWPVMNNAKPNANHEVVAKLERAGFVAGVLTQNVDDLHFKAGSERVLELHGGLNRAVCMNCAVLEPRIRLQRRMLHLNPAFEAAASGTLKEITPDGDALIEQQLMQNFVIPECLNCAGVLKPDVVFFGENVPKERVEAAWSMFNEAEAILVLGSSLTVFSGYRFVARAAKEGKPVVIVNQGETRGDKDALVKLNLPLRDVLTDLALKLEL